MSSMANMDALSKRYADAKLADTARNTLLDDLFQKVVDMQKVMDRNAFVIVLIDGDCMNFLNELIKRGSPGGDEAAKLLRQAVFDYLRYDDFFKHDHKIVIRVYANLRGLSKTYADKGILANTNAFSEFILGFNKAHPLCDFIDAGNHKEAADTKLKETLNLYVYNVHCKQIIFGASADNSYASFLSSFFVGTDVSSRIRLLKGPPFSFEFKSILPKFRWTEFTNVFRSDFISSEPVQQHALRRVPEFEPTHARELSSTSVSSIPSMPWPPKHAADFYDTVSATNDTSIPDSESVIPSKSRTPEVDEDSNGSGVDVTAKSRCEQALSYFPTSQALATRPRANNGPAAGDIAAALVDSTNERLQQSPRALDFGAVKHMVERKLGLTPDFWGKSAQDEWFNKSKDIIKKAVEDWVERTGNPPPKNATWMLQYFTSTEESPASVMRSQSSKVWRTKVEMHSPLSGATIIEAPGREHLGCIFQNSEGQRVDVPNEISAHPGLIAELRERKPRLCNYHHLIRDCSYDFCTYDHKSSLTYRQLEALMYLCRGQRCPQGSACVDRCFKGHMCPNGRNCRHSNDCKFADLHGIDTGIATKFMVS